MEHKLPQISGIEEQNPTAKWPGCPGESVFRIVVPWRIVDSIKTISGETKARVVIFDSIRPIPDISFFPGSDIAAVMISATEELDSPHPPAVDGLLQIHKCILESLTGVPDIKSSIEELNTITSTKFLVNLDEAKYLDGNEIIKSIENESNCTICLLDAARLPIYVVPGDHIIDIFGKPESRHKAVMLIASQLRKFLVHWTVIPTIEVQMEHMDPRYTWVSPNASRGLASLAKVMMDLPVRISKECYSGVMTPLPKKQPHPGISAYGQEAQMPGLVFPKPHGLALLTLPLSYADTIIGENGSSITCVRRISGSEVSIIESDTDPSEMMVEIRGSSRGVDLALDIMQIMVDEAKGLNNVSLSQLVSRASW